MFFHPVVKIDFKMSNSSKNNEDKKKYYDAVGLKPIQCVTPVTDFMRNSFGHLMNDIQAFMRTSDPQLQASIVRNLDTVMANGQNKDLTIQDCFDTMIPNNVQTPAEISRFVRLAASKFEGVVSRHSKVSDLSKKVEEKVNDTVKEVVDVDPE